MIICLDFDGVCAQYDGWKGEDVLGDPMPGLQKFLERLRDDGHRAVIHSTRPAYRIERWLTYHRLTDLVHEVCDTKPMAAVYIDDRGCRFGGSFRRTVLPAGHFVEDVLGAR